ncbi:MAG: diguanylate cyclase [Candidatus Sulfobium sp.]
MKILIADDDPLSRKLLEKTLGGWGHETLAVNSGGEAWKTFLSHKVNFIIADWLMPGMNGPDLCSKIRASDSSEYVYFILLTGKGRKEDIIAGLDAGADDYVTKPFEPDELRVRLLVGERILNFEKQISDKNGELVRLNARLEELARLDPLMDIGNRRSLYETIQKVHHRACRSAHVYGLIMCDIDNFKSYNDSYGHLAGDAVLRNVANSIKKCLRISDYVFRYGGEEIVIVLPDQDMGSSVTVAERIRYEVESLRIEHKSRNKGVLTVSCGVAAFDVEGNGSKWETLLECADKALYMAKSSGRNTVCSYPEETL